MKGENKLLRRTFYGGEGIGIKNKYVVILLFVGTMAKSGFAQMGYHPYQYPNMLSDPYRQYSYQFMPSLPGLPGHAANLIGGGRIVETIKAHPLHYSSMHGGPSYASSPAAPSKYSGYYYVGDKQRHRGPPTRGHPPYTASSSMYSAPPAYFQRSPPAGTSSVSTSSPPIPTYGSSSYPPPPPPPSSPYHHPYSRFPPVPVGPIGSPSTSMDTYREALDLFTEVVHKLEKEAVPGFSGASMYPYPGYLQSSLTSNGIYGSTSGFPHHLDHIMGPDFLNRARKLYNKIIKEQDHSRGVPLPSYYTSGPSLGPSSAPSYAPSSGPSFGPSSGPPPPSGLSYLESAMHSKQRGRGGRGGSRSVTFKFNRNSPYARNMVLDKITPDSALERSLIDTVKSLETSRGKTANSNINFAPQSSDRDDDEDSMDTSESRFVPQIMAAPPTPAEFQYNQQNFQIQNFPSMPPSPPQLELPEPSSVPASEQPSVAPNFQAESKTMTIPLNENDFIEHPLPYNEYEELIKDTIAASQTF